MFFVLFLAFLRGQNEVTDRHADGSAYDVDQRKKEQQVKGAAGQRILSAEGDQNDRYVGEKGEKMKNERSAKGNLFPAKELP